MNSKLNRFKLEQKVSIQVLIGVPYQSDFFTSHPVLVSIPYSVDWGLIFKAIENAYEKMWEDSIISLEYLSWVREYTPRVLALVEQQNSLGGALKAFCETLDAKAINIPGIPEYISLSMCKLSYSAVAELMSDLYKWAIEIIHSEDISDLEDELSKSIFYNRLYFRVYEVKNKLIRPYEKEIYKAEVCANNLAE
jgi:hypothetical protein